jgi:hypothetical protein
MILTGPVSLVHATADFVVHALVPIPAGEQGRVQ